MLQDDSWAIVERSCIVAKTVNDAIQRRQDWRAGFHKHIEAKMDCAPFRTIAAFRLVGIACVNWASFVVASNNMCGSREWIDLTHHCISSGDCKLADRVRVYHVAKVDHADDLPGSPGEVANQDIVVVGIIVNDAHA